jgi:hypothetical protein
MRSNSRNYSSTFSIVELVPLASSYVTKETVSHFHARVSVPPVPGAARQISDQPSQHEIAESGVNRDAFKLLQLAQRIRVCEFDQALPSFSK